MKPPRPAGGGPARRRTSPATGRPRPGSPIWAARTTTRRIREHRPRDYAPGIPCCTEKAPPSSKRHLCARAIESLTIRSWAIDRPQRAIGQCVGRSNPGRPQRGGLERAWANVQLARERSSEGGAVLAVAFWPAIGTELPGSGAVGSAPALGAGGRGFKSPLPD